MKERPASSTSTTRKQTRHLQAAVDRRRLRQQHDARVARGRPLCGAPGPQAPQGPDPTCQLWPGQGEGCGDDGRGGHEAGEGEDDAGPGRGDVALRQGGCAGRDSRFGFGIRKGSEKRKDEGVCEPESRSSRSGAERASEWMVGRQAHFFVFASGGLARLEDEQDEHDGRNREEDVDHAPRVAAGARGP